MVGRYAVFIYDSGFLLLFCEQIGQNRVARQIMRNTFPRAIVSTIKARSFEVRMRDISSFFVGFPPVCLQKCRLKRKYVSDGILFSVRKYQAGSAVFIVAAAFSRKRTVVWALAFEAFAAFFETVRFLETVLLKAVFFETVFFMAFTT